MVLSVQIVSFIASFCYGIFFYLLLELNAKIIYSSHILLKVIGSFLFVLFHTFLYFLILIKINYGYIHIYFLFCIGLGYLLCKVVYKKFVKRK